MTLEMLETSTADYYIENKILYMRAEEDADFTLEATIEGGEARKKMQRGIM